MLRSTMPRSILPKASRTTETHREIGGETPQATLTFFRIRLSPEHNHRAPNHSYSHYLRRWRRRCHHHNISTTPLREPHRNQHMRFTDHTNTHSNGLFCSVHGVLAGTVLVSKTKTTIFSFDLELVRRARMPRVCRVCV